MFKLLKSILVLCALLTTPAFGQTSYPDPENIYVNDYASLMTARDERYVRTALEELRAETGIEFTVLTIQNMSDYGHVGAIEPFATDLFNAWGVGNADANDGVLLLVSRGDRKMRIEVGSGYGRSKNDPMKRIIDNIIIPEFKQSAYSAGIRKGVNAVIYDLTGAYPKGFNPGTVTEALDRPQGFIKRYIGWLIALIIPGFFLTMVGFVRRLRSKPRICPNDGSKMSRLSEDWDDKHLKSGQVVEERLNSIDYDVWKCAQCDHVTIQAYHAWFSGFGACRACSYRTLEGDSITLKRATTSSEGVRRTDYNCHHCGETYSVTKAIPRRTESSSSSSSGGSSFGGGSSSGGGASGSW
ncbi:TPM domain-containing protein [Halocynthiibacter namhaensis]|uniref:TPM domain-containing protein n=1 Tax=Halocynthiibacter namhaensis TaxID=1290553 RepID=UPI000579955A|nr:TPM domain-containing protein [Halocynthiibacter namhaensis]